MSKNLIPEIAKMLRVEIGEEFKVAISELTYRFTKERFECRGNDSYNRVWSTAWDDVLMELLDGRCKVIKLPWRPQFGEGYWSYASDHFWVVWSIWAGTPKEYAILKCGCVFRTKEEALEARPRIYKELTGKDWENIKWKVEDCEDED